MSRSTANLRPCREPLVPFTWAGLTRPVHEGIVGQLEEIRAEWERRGGQAAYEIRSWWGYAPRDCKTGAHPRAVALDINPAENPMVSKRTPCPSDMPQWFIDLFKARGFGHGADWKSKCDAMHFSKLPNEGGNGRIYEVNATSPGQSGPVMLRKGAKGPAVRDWQTALNAHGGAKLDVDGDFGPATEAATKSFQRAHGLDVDGVVGPKTRAKMDELAKAAAPPAPAPTPPPPPAKPKPEPAGPRPIPDVLPHVKRGARGQHVRNLQGLLVANGAFTAIDGDFGPATERSLRSWQGRAGIGADGVAGPVTWGRLLGPMPEVGNRHKGQAARNVQGLLRGNGVALIVDGDFGPRSERALRAWQARAGIGADGICGPITWRRLCSA